MTARLTDRDRALRAITEAQWQRTVTDLATRLGWCWYAPPKAGVRALGSVRGTVAGFPDLTLVRHGSLVFAELKRETGSVSPAQDEWLSLLRATGAVVRVWRPSDLLDVREVLA